MNPDPTFPFRVDGFFRDHFFHGVLSCVTFPPREDAEMDVFYFKGAAIGVEGRAVGFRKPACVTFR